ncbi:MAG: putative zinc-binding metallopeptidase [Alistipes sp.]|nr:putative zinc-binding metallopeptidase [Alistipes sp.]
MKYSIIRIAALAAAVLGIVSCEKDEPDARSIFPVDNSVQTEFDAWLMRHFVEPYNIRYEYKMPDRETNFGYWVSPPPVEKAIEIAKLVKFSTLDAMAEMMSTGSMDEDPTLFAKKFFPKVLFVVGSFEISNTGTTNLASAENGLQINILGAKFFDRKIDSERIAGTMLHEFTHILDGTYPVHSEYT